MRKNVFKLAMIVMALFLSTACFAQAGKVNNFRIKRGTNVSQARPVASISRRTTSHVLSR